VPAFEDLKRYARSTTLTASVCCHQRFALVAASSIGNGQMTRTHCADLHTLQSLTLRVGVSCLN
jgi:hypothetical protein